MNPSYPLQHQLFERIEKRFPHKNTWLRQYMERSGLSQSPAYSRFRGEKPISFDEGLSLLTEHGIALEDLFPQEGQLPAGIVQFRLAASPHTALGDYLLHMQADLKRLSQTREGRIYHQTNDLPVFWLKQSRELAAFKLYHWLRHYANIEDAQVVPFGRRWMEKPEVAKLLDDSRAVLQHYRLVPGLEFWSTGMFDKIIHQMVYAQSLDQLEEKDRARSLANSLYGLIDHLEQVAIKGNKDPDAPHRGGALKVYDNRTFDGNDLIMGVSESFSFLYSDFGPFYMRTDQREMAVRRAAQLEQMLPHSTHISGSELARRHFFRLLRETVKAKLEGFGG